MRDLIRLDSGTLGATRDATPANRFNTSAARAAVRGSHLSVLRVHLDTQFESLGALAMTSTGTDPKGSQGDNQIKLEGPTFAVAMPLQARSHLLVAQEFHLIMEGAGSPAAASVRDLCLGFLAASIIAVLTTLATADFKHVAVAEKTTVTSPAWGPLLLCFGMGAAALAAGLTAYVAHSRTKGDKGRRSYQELVKGLCPRLEIEDTYSARVVDARALSSMARPAGRTPLPLRLR